MRNCLSCGKGFASDRRDTVAVPTCVWTQARAQTERWTRNADRVTPGAADVVAAIAILSMRVGSFHRPNAASDDERGLIDNP